MKFVKFVHTFLLPHAIIYIVKTPPIHYIVFATPHKKKYLLRKGSLNGCLFTLQNQEFFIVSL